jgi:hypothetical protein
MKCGLEGRERLSLKGRGLKRRLLLHQRKGQKLQLPLSESPNIISKKTDNY